MVAIDTLEGVIEGRLWYHYDVGSDVLYVRLISQRNTSALGEETDDGLILLRGEVSDEVVGVTIVG